ncbi:MAG: biopolymer transporter ExbD [Synechococcales cyanobacterium RU_4_20]|nr:biopolymer transporter ExbD [Synechococcales cyanobacterium RU_4_20]NJR67625.1 biopolymer transporter ExbD [Synechococcales cyanobacterium CRU_2_2]
MRRIHDELIDRRPEINIVPMIDVTFALLTFFILATLFLTKSEGLPVNLPVSSQARLQQEPVRMTISVDLAGKVYVDKTEVAVSALGPQLAEAKRKNPNTLVVLNADGGVTHDRVVAVLDQIRSVPGLKMAIATKRP